MNEMKKTKKNRQHGFTLVEISIALVIIGLLIGGILKGKELIQNARVNAMIKDIDTVKASLHLFQDKFQAMPGDIAAAQAMIPNCTVDNSCFNGNGNGRVGMGGTPALGTIVATQVETVQFWKHLALADMITGIDTSAPMTNPRAGTTHPRASYNNAAFEFFYNPTSLLGASPASHVLRITNRVLLDLATDPGAVSPHVAARLERKLDDGQVNRGSLIVWDYGNQGCDNDFEGNSATVEAEEGEACVLLFLF